MTGRRATSQANHQRRLLSRLREARQRRPGPEPGTLPAVELVVVNAIAQAVADDLKAGDTNSTTRIYLAVTAMQQRKEAP